jgi:hypothetical protein
MSYLGKFWESLKTNNIFILFWSYSINNLKYAFIIIILLAIFKPFIIFFLSLIKVIYINDITTIRKTGMISQNIYFIIFSKLLGLFQLLLIKFLTFKGVQQKKYYYEKLRSYQVIILLFLIPSFIISFLIVPINALMDLLIMVYFFINQQKVSKEINNDSDPI